MLENCKEGKHPLIEILASNIGFDVFTTVRWCPICGSIVVDNDKDNRVYPGEVMKMRTHKFIRESIK